MDYQSTTPCDPRVVKAMLPYFSEYFSNPSSLSHAAGRDMAAVVSHARANIASFINAEPRDLIFTASATEANNLALKGLIQVDKIPRRKVVVCGTDHPSVLKSAQSLNKQGYEVYFLKVDSMGQIDREDFEANLDEQTLLLSVCHGNSEIGSLQDLKYLSNHCRALGVFFHVDATQAALTEVLNVETQGIDLLSLSGHKLYGPKGIGVLYRRRKQPRVRMVSQLDGGDQEWGLRAGTLNVPAIVGMAKACELVQMNREQERVELKRLRDHLFARLEASIPGLWVNGGGEQALVNNLNIGIAGLDAQALLCEMKAVQCSLGSSCSVDLSKPSHVLLGLGLNAAAARSCLRLSVGRLTTEADIDFVSAKLVEGYLKCMTLSALQEVVS